jgi:hypothetical protein
MASDVTTVTETADTAELFPFLENPPSGRDLDPHISSVGNEQAATGVESQSRVS